MPEHNPNSRLEAFCDGVFAIALTLLIIDIKIPHTTVINGNQDFWLALKHITPSIFTFVLSFGIILITWVNHHNTLKLVNKSSASFIYANGFLLLTVVFMPFPTALMGEHLTTSHAAPAVMLFTSTMAFQAIGWVLQSRTALRHHLGKSEKATQAMRVSGDYGYMAFLLYSICTIIAFWFPVTIAIITTLNWIVWLIYGIRIKHQDMSDEG